MTDYDSEERSKLLQDITAHFTEILLGDAAELLSAERYYTFTPVGDGLTKLNPNTFRMMLFLGENENFQTWATLRIYRSKSPEVIMLRVDVKSSAAIHVTNYDDLTIAEPLATIAAQRAKHGNDYLRSFVKFIFLKNNELCVAFKAGTKLNTLEAAVKHLARYYCHDRGM